MLFTRLLAIALSLAAAACAGGARDEALPAGRAAARLADVLLPSGVHPLAARVSSGATLASLLHAHHVAEEEASAIVSIAASVFDPRKLRADQPYRLASDDEGRVRSFEYEVDGDRVLHVRRAAVTDPAFTAEMRPIEKLRKPAVVRGAIDRDGPSLFAAMDAAGETIDLSLALADVYGGDIDFNTDLRPGDSFELLVEKQFRDSDGAFAGYGPIVAADFENAGRRLRAVRFTPAGGVPGYYDERGVSMRRFLLKSPLKFEPVVTSAFSRSRLHPILREVRAHLGVDYRAPMGAPVIAVSDGVVVEAGDAGAAGRMVHLRHANGFESEYLHLSAIAVRPGTRVRQGELIGRVGASGLATAPHLDYRLKRNGAFVDPTTVHRAMPPADPVPAAQMAAFAAARDAALTRLSGTVAAHATTVHLKTAPRQ